MKTTKFMIYIDIHYIQDVQEKIIRVRMRRLSITKVLSYYNNLIQGSFLKMNKCTGKKVPSDLVKH